MKYLIAALVLFFATPALATDTSLLDIYQGYGADTQMSLDRPHRSAEELGSWLSDTVTNALTFTPNQSMQKLNEIKPLFTEAGFQAYLLFMANAGLGDYLKYQTLTLTAIVNNTPILVGQGASAGRYAWAFEVPVVMTAMDGANKILTLRIQVGRSAAGPKPHSVLIENWQEFNSAPKN
jgi:hypothetical protein